MVATAPPGKTPFPTERPCGGAWSLSSTGQKYRMTLLPKKNLKLYFMTVYKDKCYPGWVHFHLLIILHFFFLLMAKEIESRALSSSPERVMGSGPLPDGEAARMLAPEPSCVPLLLPLAGRRGFAFTDACPPLPCSSTQHPNASKSGIRSSDENEMIEAGLSGDFPGGPLVMNLPWHAEAAGSVPGWGTKIPHAVGQQSPNTISAEPICHN